MKQSNEPIANHPEAQNVASVTKEDLAKINAIWYKSVAEKFKLPDVLSKTAVAELDKLITQNLSAEEIDKDIDNFLSKLNVPVDDKGILKNIFKTVFATFKKDLLDGHISQIKTDIQKDLTKWAENGTLEAYKAAKNSVISIINSRLKDKIGDTGTAIVDGLVEEGFDVIKQEVEEHLPAVEEQAKKLWYAAEKEAVKIGHEVVHDVKGCCASFGHWLDKNIFCCFSSSSDNSAKMAGEDSLQKAGDSHI